MHICKYVSNNLPVHNGLKQGDMLLPLLFSLLLENVIRNTVSEKNKKRQCTE